MKRSSTRFVFVILAVMLLSASAGCLVAPPEEPGSLDDIEIREYQGEELSSIKDFRENSMAGPQYVSPDPEIYSLRVHGLVQEEKTFTYDEVLETFESYEKVVTLDCVEGWSVKLLWEGLLVRDILDTAGVKPEALVVIFRSVDHYSTSFPVEYFYDNDILLAHSMNRVVLPPERGFPFQLVAESKWGYKWIKWVNEIELSDDENYEGYWEQRGYSNIGDTDQSMFD